MAEAHPGVVPMLTYENGVAAIDWLVRAFGFRERTRMVDEQGRVGHAEMETDGGLIMLASGPEGYEGPAKHREHCEAARGWHSVPYIVDGVLVYVDDVNAHFDRAERADARILSALEDAPYGRLYRAEDLEGHRWMFMQQPES